ncbi:hypothetical protein [Roseateles sp.]
MTHGELGRLINKMNREERFPEFHQAMRDALKEIRELQNKRKPEKVKG